MSKFIIYFIWGINFLAFININLLDDFRYSFSSNQDGAAFCITSKKIDKKDLYCESSEIIQVTSFIVISSYDIKLPRYEVCIYPTGRAPPPVLLYY